MGSGYLGGLLNRELTLYTFPSQGPWNWGSFVSLLVEWNGIGIWSWDK
jgi:hypothetical protein